MRITKRHKKKSFCTFSAYFCAFCVPSPIIESTLRYNAPVMETVGTKPALRATDRLRQTVAALAKLLDQTTIDIQALDSELQEHNQVSKELEQLRQAAAEWGVERAKLLALVDHGRTENGRAMAETDEAAAIALDRQVTSAVERIRADMRAQLDVERAKLAPEHLRAAEEAVQAEAARVEALIQEINSVIDNPDTELSVVIRKRTRILPQRSSLQDCRSVGVHH